MSFSLRFKIIFITVAILVLALGATTIVSSFIFSQEYGDVLQSRALIIGQGIKSQLDRLLGLGILLEDLSGFEKQLQDTVNTYQDIAYAMVVNLEGKILFHNDSTQHNKMITDAATLAAVRSGRDVIQRYSDQTGQFYDVFIPIFDRSKAHIGAIRVGFPVELITQKSGRLTVFSGVVALVSLGVAITLLVITLSVRVTKPLAKLLAVVQAFRSGTTGMAAMAAIDSNDEIGELGVAFNAMTSQLNDLVDTLEAQVADRTRQLEAVMEISRRLAVILELGELLREVVILTKETFDYYHVHIYLVDKDSRSLLLAEGYGQTGAEMKRRGHHIALDAEQSLVAQAARSGQVNTAEDVRANPIWLPNPLLPDTQAEMAIPIILGHEVVGVLDIQSEKVGGLRRDDEVALKSLANQIAIAIRNARLFARVESALAEAREAQARYLGQAWDKTDVARHLYIGTEAVSTSDEARQQFIAEGRQKAAEQDGLAILTFEGGGVQAKSLVAPVKLRDRMLGSLQLYASGEDEVWSEDDLAVIEALIDQMAQTAENLRLFEETQERADSERTLREIAEKMRSASSLERLIKIAAEELGQRLSVEYARVDMGIETQPAPDNILKQNGRE
jgi:GAF domain-containing protein/HAMP domain-containing protein